MFLVFIAGIVLVYLFLLKEGMMDHTEQNQKKYTNYQKLKDAYEEYKRILNLQI